MTPVKWIKCQSYTATLMRGSLCQGGPTVTVFLRVFLVDAGRQDPNTTISGPSSPASETPFKWRFAGGLFDGSTLNAGLVLL